MNLRRAFPSDARAIAKIEGLVDPHGWSVNRVVEQLGHDHGDAWVAMESNELVAHLLTLVVHGEVEIITVAVHPDHRRQRLGARMLAAAIAHWEEQGCTGVFLEVRRDNAAAICLYQGLGFQSVGTRRAYYRDGCDGIIMKKRLTSA